MFKHCIKIAFRNLAKYKTQTVISVIGLAVGFTCFAASALWIRYEMTYDSFHPDADRIYYVRNEDSYNDNGLSSVLPYPLAAYLQATFPEVESVANTDHKQRKITYNNHEYEIAILKVDSSFVRMFPIRVLKGTTGFMVNNSTDIAITPELAIRLFGNEDPLGKNISLSGTQKTICAIVEKWSGHSNLRFDVLAFNVPDHDWRGYNKNIFIKLHEKTDLKAFEQQLYEHIISREYVEIKHMVLTPLTAMRYDRPDIRATVTYNHIRLFALAGGLVILCALFNYLTLFLNRLRMRGREIGLRVVCGSSNTNLMMLIAVEFLLILLCSLLLGMVLFELILPWFRELSAVQADSRAVFGEIFLYAGGVTLLAFLCSLIPINYYRRQTLDRLMRTTTGVSQKNRFARGALIFQLAISLGFAFCVIVMISQIHYLMHSNRVLERAGRGSVSLNTSSAAVVEELKQIPSITEILPIKYQGFFPQAGGAYGTIRQWDDAPAGGEFMLEMLYGDKILFDFYGIRLREGQMLDGDAASNQVVINEAAARAFGWEDPIGKTYVKPDGTTVRVIGVVYDFCKTAPTVPFSPAAFSSAMEGLPRHHIIFRYQEGKWSECEQQITKLLKEKHPEIVYSRIVNAKDEYAKLLSSEEALVKLLDFVSLVCILISAFGSYSLIALYCERRRKEIAIRKVNGARPGQVFQMFFVEHIWLLVIAALISFPIGYLLMKTWLEQYALQTAIHWWIYPILFLMVAAVITSCITWHIYRAAAANPAGALKSE